MQHRRVAQASHVPLPYDDDDIYSNLWGSSRHEAVPPRRQDKTPGMADKLFALLQPGLLYCSEQQGQVRAPAILSLFHEVFHQLIIVYW